jgi:predicted glycosyltransferase involved in capsule biosynthesis
MSVSIISACKNRGKALSVSISSWIQFDEVDEIIVTDWNSDDPIDHLIKLDPRIKVITVPNELYFNQPQPLNLAASLVKSEYILKLDSDTVMNPYFNFFDHHKIDSQSFLTGTDESWNINGEKELSKTAKQQKHMFFKALWGTLYITRENYLKIGGYNENMTTYAAWEDTEIYERILILGLNHVQIKFGLNTLFSLPHLAKKRVENFQAYTENPNLEKIIRDHIKKYNDVEDDNVVHKLLLEKHNRTNYKMYKLTEESSYYVEPVIKWDIQQVSPQHYVAKKILNK